MTKLNMKTIEERADRAIYEPTDGHPLKACEVVAFARGYELGATEQKAIDDAKLLKLKSAWEKQAQINHNDEANYQQGYHDAIDKVCEWLRARNVITKDTLIGFRKAMEE